MNLPANWVDGSSQFHASHENAVENAINALSAFSLRTANYTFGSSDNIIAADATAGSITQTLPTAVGISGKQYTIKKVDSTLNTVTVATTSSQTIDGMGSHLLVFANQLVIVISNGTNWLIVDSNYAGTVLGYTELLTTYSTVNSTLTDAGLAASKLVGLAVTTIGIGRPVEVTFQGQAYNTTTNDYAGAQLLINNSAVGGAGANVRTPVTSAESFSFQAHPVLALGTSYTFEIGTYCQASTQANFYADASTPLPTYLSVVAR